MPENQVLKKVIAAIKYEFNLKQVDVAAKIGVNETYLSNVINGKSPLSEVFLGKLCSAFPVNKDYISSGLGEIFLSKSVIQTNENGDNINGQSVTVNKTETDKLLDALNTCHELLRKKDEQIDRLLTLLEKK